MFCDGNRDQPGHDARETDPEGSGRAMGDKDDGTEISDETFIPDNVNEWLEKKKAEFVNLAMKECNNQIGKAAKRLGMTYQQVKYFVERK